MPDTKTTELAKNAERWKALTAQIEELEAQREEAAGPLERAAHAILKARRAMGRTGMWPHLAEFDPTDGRFYFAVSNGIDYGDDFGAHLTLEELGVDLEDEMAKQREQEAKRLRQEADAAEVRAAHYRKQAEELSE